MRRISRTNSRKRKPGMQTVGPPRSRQRREYSTTARALSHANSGCRSTGSAMRWWNSVRVKPGQSACDLHAGPVQLRRQSLAERGQVRLGRAVVDVSGRVDEPGDRRDVDDGARRDSASSTGSAARVSRIGASVWSRTMAACLAGSASASFAAGPKPALFTSSASRGEAASRSASRVTSSSRVRSAAKGFRLDPVSSRRAPPPPRRGVPVPGHEEQIVPSRSPAARRIPARCRRSRRSPRRGRGSPLESAPRGRLHRPERGSRGRWSAAARPPPASTSSVLQKTKRTRERPPPPSRKKLDPGTGVTPTSRESHTANPVSSSGGPPARGRSPRARRSRPGCSRRPRDSPSGTPPRPARLAAGRAAPGTRSASRR